MKLRIAEQDRSPQLAYYHRRKNYAVDVVSPAIKRCARCETEKPADAFGSHVASFDGLQSWCRSCQAEYQRANRDKANARGRRWRERNPGVSAAMQRAARQACISHYSTTDPPSCACCGEGEIVFLVLDHIDGGGNAERRAMGRNLFSTLRRRGFPPGYQVLCFNCNAAKTYQGICPHEQARQRGMATCA
jgi:hypothetical protein